MMALMALSSGSIRSPPPESSVRSPRPACPARRARPAGRSRPRPWRRGRPRRPRRRCAPGSGRRRPAQVQGPGALDGREVHLVGRLAVPLVPAPPPAGRDLPGARVVRIGDAEVGVRVGGKLEGNLGVNTRAPSLDVEQPAAPGDRADGVQGAGEAEGPAVDLHLGGLEADAVLGHEAVEVLHEGLDRHRPGGLGLAEVVGLDVAVDQRAQVGRRVAVAPGRLLEPVDDLLGLEVGAALGLAPVDREGPVRLEDERERRLGDHLPAQRGMAGFGTPPPIIAVTLAYLVPRSPRRPLDLVLHHPARRLDGPRSSRAATRRPAHPSGTGPSGRRSSGSAARAGSTRRGCAPSARPGPPRMTVSCESVITDTSPPRRTGPRPAGRARGR